MCIFHGICVCVCVRMCMYFPAGTWIVSYHYVVWSMIVTTNVCTTIMYTYMYIHFIGCKVCMYIYIRMYMIQCMFILWHIFNSNAIGTD